MRPSILSTTHRTAVSLLSVITVSLCFGACAGSSRSNGAKLSQAMQRASDDNNGSRAINTPRTREAVSYTESDADIDDHDDTISSIVSGIFSLLADPDTTSSSAHATAPAPKETADHTDSPRQIWFSLAGGMGMLNHQALGGFNHVEARLGVESPDVSGLGITVSGGLNWTSAQPVSNLARSVDGNMLIANGRVRADWHTTPSYTVLGQYFFLGCGYSLMTWDYSNAIAVNGQQVSGDALEGLDLFGGIGLNVMQTRNFRLGGEVTPGITLWMPTTGKGFDNDVFEPFPYLKFTAVVSLGS